MQSLASPRNQLAHALAQNGAGLAQVEPRGTLGRLRTLVGSAVQWLFGDTLEHVGGGAVAVGGLAGEWRRARPANYDDGQARCTLDKARRRT